MLAVRHRHNGSCAALRLHPALHTILYPKPLHPAAGAPAAPCCSNSTGQALPRALAPRPRPLECLTIHAVPAEPLLLGRRSRAVGLQLPIEPGSDPTWPMLTCHTRENVRYTARLRCRASEMRDLRMGSGIFTWCAEYRVTSIVTCPLAHEHTDCSTEMPSKLDSTLCQSILRLINTPEEMNREREQHHTLFSNESQIPEGQTYRKALGA